MKEQVVKWLRHGKSVPDGWEIVPDQRLDTHHNAYSVLIRRKHGAIKARVMSELIAGRPLNIAALADELGASPRVVRSTADRLRREVRA